MLDKFGLPTNLPRTPGELKDIQNALADVESYKSQWKADGFTPGEIEDFANRFVKNKVVDGLKNRVADSQSLLLPLNQELHLKVKQFIWSVLEM